MNEQTMRFRMGIFVLAATGLLAVLLTLFGRAPTLFVRYDRYTASFKDAPGVAPGTPIRRSGVPIGKVEKLYLDSQSGRVKVILLIDREYPLYEGDQAYLFTGLFAGETAIDIVRSTDADKGAEPSEEEQQPGLTPKPPRKKLEPGAEIIGVPPVELRALLSGTERLVPETRQVLIDIRSSLQRFDKLAPEIQETLKVYRELAKDGREALPGFRRTADEIQVAARNMGGLAERLDNFVAANQDKAVKALDNISETLARVVSLLSEENQRNVGALLKNLRAGTDNLPALSRNADAMLRESQKLIERFNATLQQTDEILTNLQKATKPIGDRTANVMKNLDESAAKLNQLLSDARDAMRGLGKGDGTLARLVSDPSLYNNLNDAIFMINRIIPRLDEILRNVETFTDKIARHPESLGVRGAIAPSKGLKDSPTAPLPPGVFPYQQLPPPRGGPGAGF